MLFNRFHGSILLVCLTTLNSAEINGSIKVCAIRVSFKESNLSSSTTGSGNFLYENQGIDCGNYTIDGAPHNRDYFRSHLTALDSYFRSVSYGKFGIDLEGSSIYPLEQDSSFILDKEMSYYNPYSQYNLQEKRLTELFRDGLMISNEAGQINYSNYDLIVIFHAGIGQDFSLPFLDPTPEDIPSTFVDNQMIQDHLNAPSILIDGYNIENGIILPETQNHLLYDISISMFGESSDPCDYQYGLTGTFTLLVGYAIGLPPLWNIENGESRIGTFGLMDQGSNNGRGIVPAPPNAWSRIIAGWESSIEPEYGQLVTLPSRSEGNIIKIAIRDDEYFLVENRNNTVKNDMSIDSIRYLSYQNSLSKATPSYMNILQDSTGIEKDTNGVFVSVPNYDIGLPASGLLIWHIDEKIINSYGTSYGINNNIGLMGVDLEESDGAQDIGYPSIFLFNDPSGGYFGDMWFEGNSQYYLSNFNMEGLNPEFGPNTFPSTSANDGSSTFIKVSDISMPGDTMSFILSHTLMVENYPDSNFNFILQYDINRDGFSEIIGGKDTIVYFSFTDSEIDKTPFHLISSEDLYITFLEYENHTIINVIEHIQDSSLYTIYNYNVISGVINMEGQEWIDSLVYPVNDADDKTLILKTESEWTNHKYRVFADPYNFGIDIGNRGITVDRFGEPITKWKSNKFDYIAGIDIDLDSNVDAITLASNSVIRIFNSDLILMSGFPFDGKLKPPVLARDLYGSKHPEVVARSADNSKLYIINNKGLAEHEIAINSNDILISLGEYKGRNAIYTSSKVYQFDSQSVVDGNLWGFQDGDIGKKRNINLDYIYENINNKLISNGYCYPNPIKEGMGTIRVETNNTKRINVKIYDLAGFYVDQFDKNLDLIGNQISEWTWDVTNLEAGVYFINIMATDDNKNEFSIIKVAVIH